MASTIGADLISVFAKIRSSTSCMLPGDAYKSNLVNKNFIKVANALTCFDKPNLEADFLPPSGVQISIRSCFTVSASRRNSFASVRDSVTDGKPAVLFPKNLMTELVL